jgi:flagellar biosynthesis protein FlhF
VREDRAEMPATANHSTPVESRAKASPALQPAAPVAPGESEQKLPPRADVRSTPASGKGPRTGDALADAAARPDEPQPVHPLIERAAQDTVRMRAELSSLREMLEMQLSSLAWNDMERRHPLHTRVLRELTRLGIEADVARALAEELPEQMTPEQARYLPLGMLSRGLPVSGRGRSQEGGVTALVGPTGVGKTTTLAKLAARAVVRHGASQVALVSTDHYRIGAAAQLEHYGRLLGVRVYPAYDAQSLRQVLELLKDCHTVLVDTAGLAGNDPRLKEQLDALREVGDLRACLVLAANAQAQSLEEAVRAYLPLKPHAAILTKLDEAPSLGGALSVLIRHRLALDYTTDGQRVPEDIAAADARLLVCRAAQALKSNAPAADEAVLAERFGAMAAQA